MPNVFPGSPRYLLGIAALTPTYGATRPLFEWVIGLLGGGNMGAKVSGLDRGWVNTHRPV